MPDQAALIEQQAKANQAPQATPQPAAPVCFYFILATPPGLVQSRGEEE